MQRPVRFRHPTFHHIVLVAVSVLSVALIAGCETRDPRKAGAALGAEHAARLEAKTLSFDEWARDLKDAKHHFDGSKEEAWDQFLDGYWEGVRPERAKVVAYAARQAGEDLSDAFQSFGEGLNSPETARALGRHVGGLLKKTEKQLDAFFDGMDDGMEDGEKSEGRRR